MTFGSLFSGIGGLDLGLERAGFTCRFQVEKDDFCRKVLAKHWTGVTQYGDITTVHGSEVERVDMLAGGFPCQDVSWAGKRVGINGFRSGLWWEYHRLISELRPRIALVENVPGLLDRGMGDVLGSLAEIGYDAEWDCVPACAFNAPHPRERVFIVAYPSRIGKGQLRRLKCAPKSQPKRDVCRQKAEPGIKRILDGVPNRVERLIALGNSVHPAVAEWIGNRIMEAL